MVRVRIELTAFALSAPRLPTELTDPTKQLKTLKHGIMQMEEGIFRHKKLRRITHSTITKKFQKYSRFQYFFYYSFKTFPSSHSFYKNFRQQNICLFLDCCRADVFSAKRLILSLCYINVASVNPVSIFCFYYRRRS